MSFQPVVPMGGMGGWRFLNRTLDAQQASFARNPQLQREVEHFRQTAAELDSPAALVDDRRALTVALGAFGLDEDINARAFILRVLEDGTEDRRALANRLADKRYLAFAEAFGFGGDDLPRTSEPGFAERITEAYSARRFEAAVGATDESMRLALAARRDLAALAARDGSDRAQWFQIMGAPPLRKLFETAFGLPASFGALDLDRQLDILRSRAQRHLGSSAVAQFRDPERIEALIERFVQRADLAGSAEPAMGGPPMLNPALRGAAAVQILQAGLAGR